MILQQSILNVADNSGCRIAKCIKILGGSKKTIGKIGDIIKVSVKSVNVNSKIKKKQVLKALIIRTKYKFTRFDGSIVKFNDNSVVLLSNNENFIATRVFGIILRELKNEKFSKLLSLSNDII